MDIRYNINRIHYVLNESFVNVEISEKSSLKFGKYFEISIKESKEVKMIIPFKNIDNVNNFEFYYLSNPINENSNLVTRNSDVDSISKIIEDILLNDRFDKDYLKN
jgi:hypothetical protein